MAEIGFAFDFTERRGHRDRRPKSGGQECPPHTVCASTFDDKRHRMQRLFPRSRYYWSIGIVRSLSRSLDANEFGMALVPEEISVSARGCDIRRQAS
jgi:hypothetical protein